jgi:anti-sigma regulatory factor (Ser/Thr protein kinase)
MLRASLLDSSPALCARAFPLISLHLPNKPLPVQHAAQLPLRRVATSLTLQALVWGILTVAFAALLVLASPQSWSNALGFSAQIWMPWSVLAPIVFWFSVRFPLEVGHLLRSVPIHIIACTGCVAITLGLTTASLSPGDARPDDRPPAFERGPIDRDGTKRSSAAVLSNPDAQRNGPAWTDHGVRTDHREPFGRRGPTWWPFLGATLLRANFDGAVYLVVAAAAHALAFYRRAQDRERHAIKLAAGLNRAKLDALRLQLQPHFLFNTLNAIATLVHRDANAADELINDLSELLRLSLQTGEHEVPLSRELELLECYIAIEQTRLAERLSIIREIDPAAKDALVPTFVLQPIVENAIRHGIEPRLAPGTVTIRARREGHLLCLSVIDDGVGLTKAEKKSTRQGIGIKNSEARLHTLHGDAASLTLGSSASGGVEVRITLPFTTEPRNEHTTPAI